MNYRREILDEFEDYSAIDYKDNYSINEVWQHIGSSNDSKEFGIVQKGKQYDSEYQKKRYEIIETFTKTLIEFGNLNYAKKVSGIGYYSAWHYINFLNTTAESRGLPLIFIKKENWARLNVKLNEKQVSYIKYLVTKYSTYKVAKMYNVSQSTIHQIKQGFTWKNVKAII